MHPGSRLLDASVLVMPLVKFAGPTDPRFLSTLDRIGAELTSDSLVYRYAITGHDGLDGGEGHLPAGLHPPGPDQRRGQPGPRAGPPLTVNRARPAARALTPAVRGPAPAGRHKFYATNRPAG
jgi:hypothetical protein